MGRAREYVGDRYLACRQTLESKDRFKIVELLEADYFDEDDEAVHSGEFLRILCLCGKSARYVYFSTRKT